MLTPSQLGVIITAAVAIVTRVTSIDREKDFLLLSKIR